MELCLTFAFDGLPVLGEAAGDRLLEELRAELPDARPMCTQDQNDGRLEVTLRGALGQLPLVFGAEPVARAVSLAGYGEEPR